MTMQELATAYQDVDADTLDFIQAALQWRRNVPSHQIAELPEVWSKLKMLFEKEDEASSAELTRLAVLNETGRLIRARRETEKQIESLKQQNEEHEEAINELRREKENLEALKKDHADLEKRKADVRKEMTEMQRKYRETKQFVDSVQKNEWLKQEVKNDIQKIWSGLPLDTLDAFMEEK